MDIASYLHLLQWGAYAQIMGLFLASLALAAAGVTLVLIADIRRRLTVGAEVTPPPGLDFPAWVNPQEKKPAA